MQFLDVAVASGYAALCLSLLVLISPAASQQAAAAAAEHARLDRVVSSYLVGVGLPFLATSPFAAICASAGQKGNSTVGVDVVVDGEDCGLSPAAPPLATASLSLALQGRQVVIEAWLARG
ncbi:MAG: hypothetical protein JRN23_03255 [Nitrososphaerota archaeon]|nr:hypothetical protein [Nitrososphaerota archaeon]MDG7022283.1 hypothetical protein [Nitrososphaerota archaeon]